MFDRIPFELQSALEQVVSPSSGSRQENSLYHLLNTVSFQEEIADMGYVQTPPSSNSSRKAWFITIPAVDASNQAPLIYTGYSKVKTHISCDRYFKKNAPHLLPNHFAEIYTNATHERTVYVFFDIVGNFANFRVKECLLSTPEKSHDITDKKMEKVIRRRASTYQSHLKNLITRKDKIYEKIYTDTFVLDSQFTALLDELPSSSNNLEDIQSKVEEFKEKVILVGHANEKIKRDGREKSFQALDMRVDSYKISLKRMNIATCEEQPKIQDELTNSAVIESHHNQVVSYSDPFQSVKSMIELDKTNQLNLDRSYIALLEIEKELLSLELVSDSPEMLHTVARYRKLIAKIILKQARLFRDRLSQGDLSLSTVTLLLHHVESLVPLNQAYYDLLKNIIDNTLPSSSNLIDVCNYLHAHSGIYQIIFRFRLQVFSYGKQKPGEDLYQWGPLALLVQNRNLDCFKMYLEQGVSPNSMQISIGIEAYEVLFLLITQFRKTQDKALLSYMDLVIQYGGSLQSLGNYSIPSITPIQMEAEKAALNIKTEVGPSSFSFTSKHVRTCSNYIEFSVQELGDTPHILIQVLPILVKAADESDLAALFYSLATTIFSDDFNEFLYVELGVCNHSFRVVTCGVESKPISDINEEAYTQNSISISFAARQSEKPCTEIAIMLLNCIESLHKNLSLEKKRFLQNELETGAMSSLRNHQYWIAYFFFRSAALVSLTKCNPETIDHDKLMVIYLRLMICLNALQNTNIHVFERFITVYFNTLTTEQQYAYGEIHLHRH